ncbi:SRPBCC family protein [Paenibacillus alkalitolerans]|uniref:SRPBCC family protein n=1 Tax=Paenibacillus alkalitolerans TaxID=2799335 RepID=UPI0018F2DBDF|nr:SRPBCC domain-containing protein [Paenibacillus alkalitolerans]
MPGSIFKQEVKKATGDTWEEWIEKLGRNADQLWSHEQIKNYICDQYQVSEEWSEWIAIMYEQLMGRVPVGTSKDAGVQIGVRRTFAVAKEKAWDFLTSPKGLPLWIGDVPSFTLQMGHEYESKEGVSGKIAVVVPYHKLRMTWKRPEWDKPSRLQIYVLSTKSGKTTIAIHQEMLEDVYMREIMKRYWEEMLNKFINHEELVR